MADILPHQVLPVFESAHTEPRADPAQFVSIATPPVVDLELADVVLDPLIETSHPLQLDLLEKEEQPLVLQELSALDADGEIQHELQDHSPEDPPQPVDETPFESGIATQSQTALEIRADISALSEAPVEAHEPAVLPEHHVPAAAEESTSAPLSDPEPKPTSVESLASSTAETAKPAKRPSVVVPLHAADEPARNGVKTPTHMMPTLKSPKKALTSKSSPSKSSPGKSSPGKSSPGKSSNAAKLTNGDKAVPQAAKPRSHDLVVARLSVARKSVAAGETPKPKEEARPKTLKAATPKPVSSPAKPTSSSSLGSPAAAKPRSPASRVKATPESKPKATPETKPKSTLETKPKSTLESKPKTRSPASSSPATPKKTIASSVSAPAKKPTVSTPPSAPKTLAKPTRPPVSSPARGSTFGGSKKPVKSSAPPAPVVDHERENSLLKIQIEKLKLENAALLKKIELKTRWMSTTPSPKIPGLASFLQYIRHVFDGDMLEKQLYFSLTQRRRFKRLDLQVCSHCREAKRLEKVEHLDIENPHFVRSCANCHTLWDRDINALRNMISECNAMAYPLGLQVSQRVQTSEARK
ncbi:uncharacterized protein BJ171DRAFT_636273 [Polychytrium aggregatum]|uniref:uncharacterized protein n=1 Tax=Polychytrium aggregatum TaxID=110093 RepID=UPI0022FDCA93|nr:uncharacterized protein BJ171DRAFT_636273 [Polychytrium aggregatum]KAI9207897.1 hypothetical protein BJ171DRAFT_636273 [Polychytrium aggregatum]